MKHGELISRTTKTTYGPEQTLVDATTGKTVYSGPTSAVTGPVLVRHCEDCGEVELTGFSALLDVGCPTCGRPWEDR